MEIHVCDNRVCKKEIKGSITTIQVNVNDEQRTYELCKDCSKYMIGLLEKGFNNHIVDTDGDSKYDDNTTDVKEDVNTNDDTDKHSSDESLILCLYEKEI